MRFRLVKTGKTYAEVDDSVPATEAEVIVGASEDSVPPIIWETGNVSQIRSLLVLREAELLLAKAQLTGNNYYDWYVRNRVRDLEIKVSDLRRWLREATEKDKRHEEGP